MNFLLDTTVLSYTSHGFFCGFPSAQLKGDSNSADEKAIKESSSLASVCNKKAARKMYQKEQIENVLMR